MEGICGRGSRVDKYDAAPRGVLNTTPCIPLFWYVKTSHNGAFEYTPYITDEVIERLITTPVRVKQILMDVYTYL